LGELIWRTLRNFGRNEGTQMAAGLAYYILFSLFPIALGAIGVAGYFVGSEEAQTQLFEFFEDQLPGLADSAIIHDNITGLADARGAISLFSLVALFIAGRAVFGSLHRIMNRAWRVQEQRHFMVQQLRAFGMAGSVGFFLTVSVFLSSFGRTVAGEDGFLGVRVDLFQWLSTTLFGVVPVVFSTILFLVIYRFIPNAKVRWSDIIPASLLAGMMFELSKVGFVFYLDNFANFDRVYGSISTLMLLLLWAYVASIILVVGAETASEYGRSRQSGLLHFHGNLRPVRGGLGPRMSDWRWVG
jgi:membrane protein